MAWLMTGDGVDPLEWWMQSGPTKHAPVSAKIAKHSAARFSRCWMDYPRWREKKLHAPHVKNYKTFLVCRRAKWIWRGRINLTFWPAAELMAPIKYCKQITGRSAGIFSIPRARSWAKAKVCLKIGDANKLMDSICLFLSSPFFVLGVGED